MPRYDYQCEQCQAIFEVRATFKEKEAGLAPICPICESQLVHQIITAGFILHLGSSAEGMSQDCGPTPKPGCCG